jgi:hypothetical protein
MQVISDAVKDIHPIYWAQRGVKEPMSQRHGYYSYLANLNTAGIGSLVTVNFK